MADVLEVKKRDRTGSLASRKLRRAGRVPAVLYGHGQENEHLSIPAPQVEAILRHHSHTVKLAGDINDNALVSQVHWDPLGIDVLHLDLIRVNLQELVEVTVPIHTHGDPIGLREGGILIENEHDVEIRCSAGSIPDSIELNVNDLHLNQQLTAADLELPQGVELVTPPETVVAHIEEPRTEEEVSAAAPSGGAEPEVIARGAEDEEGNEGED